MRDEGCIAQDFAHQFTGVEDAASKAPHALLEQRDALSISATKNLGVDEADEDCGEVRNIELQGR